MCSPDEMAFHPCSCAGVGASKVLVNQARVIGENRSSALPDAEPPDAEPLVAEPPEGGAAVRGERDMDAGYACGVTTALRGSGMVRGCSSRSVRLDAMYVPSHFAVTDPAQLTRMLEGIGAADVVTFTATGIESSLVPLLHVPAAGGLGSLQGHLARANPQWKTTDPTVEALVIVNGVDGYVSPSAYPSKQETGKVVPTWNYTALHVHGRFVVHDDRDWLDALVRRLTDHHEAASSARSGAPVWSVDDAPGDYIDSMLRAIVGIEIEITRVEAKSKLSQNKSEADARGVIADLHNRGEGALADAMTAVLPG